MTRAWLGLAGLLALGACESNSVRTADRTQAAREKPPASVQPPAAPTLLPEDSGDRGKIGVTTTKLRARGVAPGGPPAVARRHGRGKSTAPVRIEFENPSTTGATVRITFEKAADDVEVRVSGYGAITVTSDPAPIRAGSFTKGQSVTFNTTFDAVEGQSKLAVHVVGTFSGVTRIGAKGLEIGGPMQTKPAQIEIDSRGRAVNVLQGETSFD